MYDLLYLDVPWRYRDEKGGLPALGGKTYATMSDEELAELPISRIANKDSLLFSWLVFPKLYEGLQIMTAWGFTPITCGFVWIKLNRKGALVQVAKDLILKGGIYSGLGSYVCGNAEICMIGKRGKGLQRASKSVKQIIFAPLSSHSSKPFEAYDRIETLYPHANKVELFARTPREGWTQTGYDFDGMDVREWLQKQSSSE